MINSLKDATSLCILRNMYFAHFHVHLKYGLALWGSDAESKRIFKLQKKVIRIISNTDLNVSCRNLFRDLNILLMSCLYISEVIRYVKSNIERMKLNEETHDHCARHKLDLHVQFCRTTVFENNVANVSIKLYNKLPNKIKKLEKIQEFKGKLKFFCFNTFFILWMSIRLTEYFVSSVSYYAWFVTLVLLSKKTLIFKLINV
jgi:hypothetical protein